MFVLKLGVSTVTLKLSVGRSVNKYPPLLFVVVLRVKPLVTSTIVTEALAITSPELSVTVPRISASTPWARAERTQESKRNEKSAAERRFLFIVPPLLRRGGGSG
jgi:hypothetical protein